MLEFLNLLLLAIFFGLGLFFLMLKKEMSSKSKYKEFVNDAIDGMENKFSSNSKYSYTNTNGMAFYKLPDGKIQGISQSKLCGISLEH